MAKKGSFSKVYDKNGDYVDVEAVRFDGTRTVQIQGDVTASQAWNGDPSSPLTLNASIGAKKVTTDKINDKAVQAQQIDDGAVGLTQISTTAMNGTVQDNDSKLATHAAVKTYVDAQISGQGTYLGKHTVAEINAMVTDNLHNGDRVMTSDSGTINLGPGGLGFDVEAGEDLILYKSGSTVQWDSMDGNFKTKQSAVVDPTASGSTLEFIDSITQNENGEITATKKTIRSASTSQTGVVQLSGSIADTVSTENNKAASEKAVRDAINALDVSSITANLGASKTLTALSETDGKIAATASAIQIAESQVTNLTSDLGGKADKVGSATSGHFAGLDANGNLTDSGKAASDFATAAQGGKADSAIQSVKVNGTALTPDSGKAVNVTAATGVKGDAESTYRTGDVNLTKANIGLGNVDNTSDASKNVLSATKLTTPRNIDGVSFDGSANIHHYGACSTAAATAGKAVTLSDSMTFTLAAGASVFVKFTNSNTASSPTLNVNSTGAKAVYRYGSTVAGTSAATSWQAGSVVHLVYDGSAWQMVGWLNDNTTYNNASLGQGYGTCATAEATAAKVVTLASYALVTGGIVAVKFTYGLCASATMNINSKGAKSIFIDGAAVTATTAKRVQAGDLAYFMYDGTQYQFLGTDKAERKFDINYRASDNALVFTKEFGSIT